MKLLLDNNLPPRIAQALNVLVEPDGHAVYHLREHFPPNTPDIEWLGTLGEEGGWAILSADMRIHKNRAEREAWRRSNTVAFFLTRWWAKQKFTNIAARLLTRWSDLDNQYRLVAPPAAFEVPPRGKLRQLKG